ncbi:MAG: CotH kinase family protein [Polyangia bacterium]
MVEVNLTLDAKDWDKLRRQGHSVDEYIQCNVAPPDPYKNYPAVATIDGQALPKVGVRKKGSFGSASISKPSLKLSLDQYTKDTKIYGVNSLTLNNAFQDPALIKQCLTYELLRKVGVPASRCNFAHVTVNGKDLGVYVDVEPVGPQMLARFFSDTTGNLYEGNGGDFVAGAMAGFEKKTNKSSPDRSDLEAVTAALAADDAHLLEKLGAVVDLDDFMTFWAMEAVLGLWDGYTNNRNNFYVYTDPKSQKMSFIVWGPDMSFSSEDVTRGVPRPQSVSAEAAIPKRLYAHPAARRMYLDRLRHLLDSAWNEKEINAAIDQMRARLLTQLPGQEAFLDKAMAPVRDFVNQRRSVITAELMPAAEWPFPPPSGECAKVVGSVSGTFETRWGTTDRMDPFKTGKATMAWELSASPMTMTSAQGGAAAGQNPLNTGFGRRPGIQLMATFPDGSTGLIYLFIDPDLFIPGGEWPFEWMGAFGILLKDPGQPTTESLGRFVHGKFHLDDAGVEDGHPIKGSFSADLMQ